jgi:hypothetical protein
MHGHIQAVSNQPSGLDQSAALAKASAAQQAATRRKLARLAAELQGADSADSVELLSRWQGSGSRQSPHREPSTPPVLPSADQRRSLPSLAPAAPSASLFSVRV